MQGPPLHLVLEDQVVRRLELVEGVADPADILRRTPGAVHGQPRQRRRVRRDVRRPVERDHVQAQRRRGRLEPVVAARLEDEGAARKGAAALGERALGDADRGVPQGVAQGREVDGAVVRHRVGLRPGGRGGALRLEAVHRLRGHVQRLEVGARRDLHVRHQPHGPGRVVIGAQLGVGEVLLLQQDLGEAAIGLVALYDQRAPREGPLLQRDGRRGAADLDPLPAEQVHQQRRARHVRLVARDQEGVGRRLAPVLHRVAALAVEVLDQLLREGGGGLQGGEQARLHVVGVVAHGPLHRLVRRVGAVPFAPGLIAEMEVLARPGHRLDVAQLGGGAAVAEGLVEADQPVVVGRHEGDVAGRPGVDIAVVPHARHAVLLQLRHLEVREPGQLAVQDGVEAGVLRRLAAEDVEERHRLVKVVDHGRPPVEVELQQVLGAQAGVVDVAVVVMEDVLAPVGRARHRV